MVSLQQGLGDEMGREGRIEGDEVAEDETDSGWFNRRGVHHQVKSQPASPYVTI